MRQPDHAITKKKCTYGIQNLFQRRQGYNIYSLCYSLEVLVLPRTLLTQQALALLVPPGHPGGNREGE